MTRFPKLKTLDRSDIASSSLPQSAHSLSDRRLRISAAAVQGSLTPPAVGGVHKTQEKIRWLLPSAVSLFPLQRLMIL